MRAERESKLGNKRTIFLHTRVWNETRLQFESNSVQLMHPRVSSASGTISNYAVKCPTMLL